MRRNGNSFVITGQFTEEALVVSWQTYHMYGKIPTLKTLKDPRVEEKNVKILVFNSQYQ